MKSNKLHLQIFILVFGFGCLVSFAQQLNYGNPEAVGISSERLARLSQAFDAFAQNGDLPGGVILVARKDQVIYLKPFGYAELAARTPMQPNALFRIASQTKAIVSTGILILQEQGKLNISDPLSRFIPEFNKTTVAVPQEGGGYEVVPANRSITIRDLLTHTSGISYGYGPASDAWEKAGIQGWYFAHRDEPILETVKRMAALPMDAQPGTQFVYGYSTDILGAVIEVASGKSLEVFLTDEIFDPLGMEDTQFYVSRDKSSRLSTVYTPLEAGGLIKAPQGAGMDAQGQYVQGPRKSFSGGAGLTSSAQDYYRFLQMMENKGRVQDKQLLSPKTVELMTVNHLPESAGWNQGAGFGLGFSIVTDMGKAGTYGSEGSFGWGGAYHSTYWVDPKEELIVVYFTQVRPNALVPDHTVLKNLIYQAILD
ncbi:MAG: hypothetical protein RLZZ241_1072 [Bacteroidota bacterium]|jgi:CubicO group peptidase (beta-lactamase class C family)